MGENKKTANTAGQKIEPSSTSRDRSHKGGVTKREPSTLSRNPTPLGGSISSRPIGGYVPPGRMIGMNRRRRCQPDGSVFVTLRTPV